MSVNGPISPKQCYYEMDYSFYSFYWLDSLEIRLDHNSTYYRSLSKNSDVKPRISHCDSQNLQYKTHPEFWPSHRRIFKTSLYYKTRLILETRRYNSLYVCINKCLSFCNSQKWNDLLTPELLSSYGWLWIGSIHCVLHYYFWWCECLHLRAVTLGDVGCFCSLSAMFLVSGLNQHRRAVWELDSGLDTTLWLL